MRVTLMATKTGGQMNIELPLFKRRYANMSVQYIAIFHGNKNDKFQMKFLIFFLFLLKTLIVGTRWNRLSEAVLTSTHNLCFRAKIRKMYTPVHASFTIQKWGVRGYLLHELVFVM